MSEKTPNRSILFRIVEVTSLGLGLLGGALAFISFWPNKSILRLIILLLAIFYTLWGVMTHVRAGHPTGKVWMEYAAIAFLGALMVWLVV